MEGTKENVDGKIRIAKIGSRFLVFEVADVARLRRQHNICAVLVGITPQAPNQTVFSSLPLELTADEVRWLVYERQAAYVADDWQAHLSSLAQPAARHAYMDNVLRQRQAAQVVADEVTAERERRGAEVRAAQAAKRAGKKAKNAASKNGGGSKPEEPVDVKKEAKPEVPVEAEKETKATVIEPIETVAADIPHKIVVATATDRANDHADLEPLLRPPPRTEGVMQQEDDFIFGGLVELERMKAERARRGTSPAPEKMETAPPAKKEEKKETPKNLVRITPTTSAGLFVDEKEDQDANALIPPRSICPASASAFASAALRAHLADRGYYTTPGLRFGGQLSVYPGDPFRYHAHFVANSYGWDEPIRMLDVVGTGRLATGVKKGLLIGGAKPAEDDTENAVVRTFTLEWAAI
ncbi:tRNA-splicing endonuclease subunit [Sporothrix stenoceras]